MNESSARARCRTATASTRPWKTSANMPCATTRPWVPCRAAVPERLVPALGRRPEAGRAQPCSTASARTPAITTRPWSAPQPRPAPADDGLVDAAVAFDRDLRAFRASGAALREKMHRGTQYAPTSVIRQLMMPMRLPQAQYAARPGGLPPGRGLRGIRQWRLRLRALAGPAAQPAEGKPPPRGRIRPGQWQRLCGVHDGRTPLPRDCCGTLQSGAMACTVRWFRTGAFWCCCSAPR